MKIARLSEYRRTYTELDAEIAATQQLIGEHMDKMVAAPKKTGRVSGLWTWSREEHEKRIGAIEHV